MELEQLEHEYERWSEEFGRAIVTEFIEAVRLGLSLDNSFFHPEKPRARSKSQSPEARAANEGAVDWVDRVRRKLGCIKIDIIVDAARQGMATNEIAARAQDPPRKHRRSSKDMAPRPIGRRLTARKIALVVR